MNNHIGRETVIEALGKTWTLARYTRKILSDLLAWALARLPDPIEQAKKDIVGFPLEIQKDIVASAVERKKARGLNDPEVQEQIGSLDGVAETLYLLLKPAHPDVTRDLAGDILDEVMGSAGGMDRLHRAIERCSGKVPAKEDEADAESKSQPQ